VAIADHDDSRDQLVEMIKLQAEGAVQMRSYMPVFFGGGDLPPDVFARWHTWSRQWRTATPSSLSSLASRYLLIGGPDEVAERLSEFAEAGVETVLCQVAADNPTDRERTISTLARNVLPKMRR